MTSALAVARDIREGRRRAADVLDEALARIAARDGELNCFVTPTHDRARREAADIDRRRAAGQALPALGGVPYAVKNLFDVEGEVTLSGGRVNRDNPRAERDATLVARMRAAGAVLVGTLNMDEHAYGFTTENTHYGPTRNPHDTARTAGGSSGGSAAAVAAGMVPITLGSDTNGSIRVPCSMCGVFGLKPTYGRLPRTGTFPFVASLDHLGPFASSVDDLATAYDVLQGPDPEDPACAQRPRQAVGPLGSALRVGMLGGYFDEWATPAARQAVQYAATALDCTTKVELAGAERARAAAFVITGAEAGALHRARLRERYDDYEPRSRDRLVAGSLIPAPWLFQAQRARRQALEEALRCFERHDLLLAAATPLPAQLLGTESIEINGRAVPCRPSLGLLTQPLSCLGLPVCAVPVWPDAAGGLPIAVQLIAAPWREDLCLAGAQALARAGVATCRIA